MHVFNKCKLILITLLYTIIFTEWIVQELTFMGFDGCKSSAGVTSSSTDSASGVLTEKNDGNKKMKKKNKKNLTTTTTKILYWPLIKSLNWPGRLIILEIKLLVRNSIDWFSLTVLVPTGILFMNELVWL